MPAGTRYAKRWKRWVGFYLVVAVPLYLLTDKIPRMMAGPVYDRDIFFTIFLLALVGWGIYWIVRNPRRKEGPALFPGGSLDAGQRLNRRAKIALAIALVAGLLVIYQLLKP
jgi:hypothetical protein